MRILLLVGCLLSTLSLFGQSHPNACVRNSTLHVVVIGSSTAAGAGSSIADSAWVNRYRSYLQSINPQNQVSNLAIGGTTTYHIMPDSFMPPANRPSTNSSNNISEALRLGADAIIVNMPSNDAANGFGLNEQMSNFITLFNTADSADVPLWVCTTQPRNFSAANRALQAAVRDSILSYFGPQAIDFWTGIGDSTDDLSPQYDSGDGVHLNDAGHALLFGRVLQKNIPSLLADTASITDYALFDLQLVHPAVCGDSSQLLQVIIGNTGPDSAFIPSFTLRLDDLLNNQSSDSSYTLSNALAACQIDTFDLYLNSYEAQQLNLTAFLQNADANASNDSSAVVRLESSGHPSVSGFNDTLCLNEDALLLAQTDSSDRIHWYTQASGGTLLHEGDSLLLPQLPQSSVYYAEAVRGNPYFDEILSSSTLTNVNWNGIMFDIVAKDTLVLDSISTRMPNVGSKTVVGYYRMGSHQGQLNNPTAWSNWGSQTVQINAPGDLAVLDFSDRYLLPGDTLGVYLHLQASNEQLSYLSTGGSIVYSDDQLEVHSGSGISHTFGTSYTPRNWSGEVYYHHGYRPGGDCSSPRIAVEAIISQPAPDLGNDTLILNGSVTLHPGNFSQYLWSTGSQASSIQLSPLDWVIGDNWYWVEVTDAWGCTSIDSINIEHPMFDSYQNPENAAPTFYPNPNEGRLYWRGISIQQLEIVDVQGRIVQRSTAPQLPLLLSENLGNGLYFVRAWDGERWHYAELVVQR